MARPRSVFWLIVAVALLPAAAVGAHTEVQRATPGPGEVIEGSVDEVVLVFLDEILPGPTVEISGPDGIVPSSEPDHEGRTVRVAMDASDTPGDYIVRYAFTAMDGDHQSEAYRFRITEPAEGVLSAGAAVALAGVVGALLIAVTRRRVHVEANGA